MFFLTLRISILDNRTLFEKVFCIKKQTPNKIGFVLTAI